jgi:glycosyltransferase involved in cell wall biosynthesis
LRIALVSDAIYPWHTGGKEIRYHELTQGLLEAGHQVEVLTMNWWQDQPTGAPESTPEGLRYRPISRKIPLYENGKRSMKEGLFFALACLRVLRVRADVVEADHMPYLQLFPLWLVTKIRRLPLVVTWHEYWGLATWRAYIGRMGWIAALIERVATKLPTHIVAVSPATAKALEDAGVRPARITVAENGVGAHAEPGPRVNLLAVGRLIAHKRFDTAIEAFAILNAEDPTLRLEIVGEGPEEENLRKLVADLGLGHAVTFHGTLPEQEDLWRMLASAKALVAPSEREGYGLAVAEALTLGTPAVVSDHPDNASQDLVEIGRTGEIAAHGDQVAFATAIRAAMVLDHDQVGARFRETNPENGWKKMVETYESIYRRVTTKRPAGAARRAT